MKLLSLFLIFLLSSKTYSFEQMTLLKDLVMERSANADVYVSKFQFHNGGDRCELILIADGLKSTGHISQATVFSDVYVDQNECYFDLIKTCKIGLSAFNAENDLNLSLTCSSKGFFARVLNEQKINQIISDMLFIR